MNEKLPGLIEGERIFFQKVFERQSRATMEMREQWRAETILQRRRRVSSEIYDLLGGVVKYGPFKGLSLAKNNWWGGGDFGSMLLGLYEKEILDFLFSERLAGFESFVDVGAADGYYAIGMLRSGRVKNAVCFELSEEGQRTIASNAESNSVSDRIEIFGAADRLFYQKLSDLDLAKTVVLVDAEGAEFEIFDDDSLAALKQATIVIEIHNWVEDFWDKYTRFLTSAAALFNVEFIAPAVRDLTQFPELNDFTDDNRYLICSEGRPNVMRFMVLTSRG